MLNIQNALFLLIILLPTYLIRFLVLGIPFTFLEVMILLLFIYWVLDLYKQNKKVFKTKRAYFVFLLSYFFGIYSKIYNNKKNKVDLNYYYEKFRWIIILFLISGVFGVMVAPDIIKALGIFKAYIVEPLLFLIVFINVINGKMSFPQKRESRDPCFRRDDIQNVLYVLGISSLIISLYGVIQYIFGFGLLMESYYGLTVKRITSFFEYPNAIGLYLGPILGIYFIWFLHEIFKKKKLSKNIIFVLAVLVFGVIAIVLARSEAALVALIFTSFIFGLLYNSKIRIISIILLLIIGIGLGIKKDIKDKVIEKITLEDFSGKIRQHTYKETWIMLKDNAVFGAGLSGYQEVMQGYHQDVFWVDDVLQPIEIYLYPHNIVFNFWSELGILGVISFCLLVVYFFLFGINNKDSWQIKAAMAGMCVLLIHGLVDVPYFKNDLAIIFWVIIGIIMVGNRIHKRN